MHLRSSTAYVCSVLRHQSPFLAPRYHLESRCFAMAPSGTGSVLDNCHNPLTLAKQHKIIVRLSYRVLLAQENQLSLNASLRTTPTPLASPSLVRWQQCGLYLLAPQLNCLLQIQRAHHGRVSKMVENTTLPRKRVFWTWSTKEVSSSTRNSVAICTGRASKQSKALLNRAEYAFWILKWRFVHLTNLFHRFTVSKSKSPLAGCQTGEENTAKRSFPLSVAAICRDTRAEITR